LVNPVSTAWSALAPYVQNIAEIERLIALRDWVGILERSSYEKNGVMVEKKSRTEASRLSACLRSEGGAV
jgi:hypothetical protein